MTAPNFAGYPAQGSAPTQQRLPNGYVPMAGGYESAIAAQNQQGGFPPPQPGFGPPQPSGFAPLQEGVSPLSQVPPRVAGVEPRQQVTQPQVHPQQPFYQQPQYQSPQPQFQPPQPQYQPQPPQPPQPTATDLNQRVYGANIPAELQGRTLGEIVGITNGLRQIHLQSLTTPQVATTVPPLRQDTPARAPEGQSTAFDWRRPDESIARTVDERLNHAIDTRLAPMLAPMQQQSMMTAVQSARAQAAQELGPAFAHLEPIMLQRMQGIDPRALTNPETWRVAARVAIGEVMIQNAQQAVRMPQQPNGGPGVYPIQQVQPNGNPAPNLNSFFSEQPNQGGPVGNGALQLSPQERAAADAMSISHADYAAWKFGVSRSVA